MEFSRLKLLYRLVSKNQRLAIRRHPMFEQNKIMKVLSYLFIGFWAAYLVFFGVMFARVFESTNYESFDWINAGLIYFLAADFVFRFGLQETPAQEIKPYKMLPIPQNFLLNIFLVRMGLRLYNLFWGFFLVPFGVLAVWKFFGFGGFLGFLFGWWLMFVMNSYWYLIWRTMSQRSILYLLIPAAIYAAFIYFGFFFNPENTWFFDASVTFGRGFCQGNILTYLLPIAVSVALFYVNRSMQRECIYKEIAKEEKVAKVKSTEMSWLNRFGIIGEYMKLEIKSTMRNKVPRTQFMMGVVYMILFCCLFAFTDVYDNQPFMKTFICVYCFACLGTMTLTSVMCVEGNYIDFLMSRKESVLSLLKAKYIFNCIMLLFPLLFALMPIFKGKVLFIEAVSCMFFAMGCIFPFLFQLAVYNKQSLPLNEKMTRNGRGSKAQIIFSFAALFAPMIIMYILIVTLDIVTASWIMLALGLVGTICSPMWLRSIYRRFMIRRYDNMEGFRDSRNQ